MATVGGHEAGVAEPEGLDRPDGACIFDGPPCRRGGDHLFEAATMTQEVWTIGHSTRTIEEFVLALQSERIELIVDVRRFPGSRRLPQFGAESLRDSLEASGIAYHWITALGGRRRPSPASANLAWRNAAFAAYAEYLETEEFAEGLGELLMLAGGMRTAIMCAEILWWRCHRRLIADVLVSLGMDVVHLTTPGKGEHHRLAPPARLEYGRLSYRAAG